MKKPLLYVLLAVSVIFNVGLWVENQQLIDENDKLRGQQIAQQLAELKENPLTKQRRTQRQMERRRLRKQVRGDVEVAKKTNEESGVEVRLPLRVEKKLQRLSNEFSWSPEVRQQVATIVHAFLQQQRDIRYDRQAADITAEEAIDLSLKLQQKTRRELRLLVGEEASKKMSRMYGVKADQSGTSQEESQ